MKQLVRKESASPENVPESKCYEDYIFNRNQKLRANQETSKEKSASKEKGNDADGKADPKEKSSPGLVDSTKQQRVSASKEGTGKRRHDDIAGLQSGKADPPQPEQPDLVKRGRLSISKDVDNARTTVQPLQQPHDVIHTEKDDEDEEDDSDDLRGIWDKVMDYLPDMAQISEVIKLAFKSKIKSIHILRDEFFSCTFGRDTYLVLNIVLVFCGTRFLPITRRK